MKIFKFGGASVKDAKGFENVKNIIDSHKKEQLLVVVSAMGKTTNLLELLINAYFHDDKENSNIHFQTLKEQHIAIINELFGNNSSDILLSINTLIDELSDILQEPAGDNFDYEYDRIVSYGEILSTKIVAAYLQMHNINNIWKDARKLIRTDNTYREGIVDWNTTQKKIQKHIQPYYNNENTNQIIVTQGFIGGTSEGLTTTLGREGSDFSAAVFAFALNAESVTIWKDVDGLLNADPKLFNNTIKLETISYHEAIELAYYGASVIHPKTLKPLQNKNIPLWVKSFIHPKERGSLITHTEQNKTIPCFICKKNQVLISIMPKDFSFIAEDNLSTIFALFAYFGVKINLMQNSALSFSLCVDNRNSIENLIEELQTEFFVRYNTDMELFTIRHYDKQSIINTIQNREIVLEQKNRTTVQYVLKSNVNSSWNVIEREKK